MQFSTLYCVIVTFEIVMWMSICQSFGPRVEIMGNPKSLFLTGLVHYIGYDK
jgi:hypothetical protein